MAFHVTSVEIAAFPDERAIRSAEQQVGVTVEQLRQWLAAFSSSTPLHPGIGHQQVLAVELERYFEESLTKAGLQRASLSVSPSLRERVDFAASRTGSAPALLGEIEFRPNFEKDLVKFAIAARNGLLGLGLLVVAGSRGQINPSYSTMPEYAKVVRVVKEFAPTFPLCVLGMSGLVT